MTLRASRANTEAVTTGRGKRNDRANEFYAPVKSVKGASEEEKRRSKAADDLYSQAVSSVRKPIEALFSWLNKKQIFKELVSAAPLADC